jgi:hypothetical protein
MVSDIMPVKASNFNLSEIPNVVDPNNFKQYSDALNRVYNNDPLYLNPNEIHEDPELREFRKALTHDYAIKLRMKRGKISDKELGHFNTIILENDHWRCLPRYTGLNEDDVEEIKEFRRSLIEVNKIPSRYYEFIGSVGGV